MSQFLFGRRDLAAVMVFAAIWPGIVSADSDPDLLALPSAECPTISPNGQLLAFVSDAAGSRDLWIASRNGSNSRPLLSWSNSIEECPDWSSDGSSVVFSSNRGGSSFNVWRVRVSDAVAVQLTSGGGDNTQARVSPTGGNIVFLSNRSGKRELWLMDADGGNQRNIGLIPQRVSDPVWSPTGAEFAYVGCTGGYCNLYAISVDAATARRITTGQYDDWHPDWSAFGIVFASNRSGSHRLWMVAADGSGLRQLTAPPTTSDLFPRWIPNSDQIVFSRSGSREDGALLSIWSTDSAGSETRLTRIVGYFSKGDANTDGVTDCADMSLVRSAFGARVGQSRFRTRADLNSDGIVDLRDLTIVSRNLPAGTSCQ